MRSLQKQIPNQIHTDARNAIVEAMRPFESDLTPVEMLAVVAQIVGNLIAFQDQRSLSPEQAMEIVTANIMEGNSTAIQSLLGAPAGEA